MESFIFVTKEKVFEIWSLRQYLRMREASLMRGEEPSDLFPDSWKESGYWIRYENENSCLLIDGLEHCEVLLEIGKDEWLIASPDEMEYDLDLLPLSTEKLREYKGEFYVKASEKIAAVDPSLASMLQYIDQCGFGFLQKEKIEDAKNPSALGVVRSIPALVTNEYIRAVAKTCDILIPGKREGNMDQDETLSVLMVWISEWQKVIDLDHKDESMRLLMMVISTIYAGMHVSKDIASQFIQMGITAKEYPDEGSFVLYVQEMEKAYGKMACAVEEFIYKRDNMEEGE